MVVDKLENISRYALIIKNCDKLDVFFKANKLKNLEPGRYPVEGSDMVVNVFDTETRTGFQTPWEIHHFHLDIHIVIKGCEEVEWTPAHNITQSREYVKERDVEFFSDAFIGSRVLIEEGYFCLLMPEDAHKPAQAPNDLKASERKIVVKAEV